jgi:SAM-dependent methyltransferase
LRALAFRTGAIKWWWRYRHFIDGSYREAPPADAPTDRHREHLWSIVASLSAASLVEVGCGDGNSLVLFARKAPNMRLSALDLNPLALAIAERRVRDARGTPGEFRRGAADRLPFPDAFADVAVSDGVFMYLQPADALAALREMRRVARRALIVHTFVDDSLAGSTVRNGDWIHPLARLVKAAIPNAKWTRESSEIVASRQWRETGAVFVVTW